MISDTSKFKNLIEDQTTVWSFIFNKGLYDNLYPSSSAAGCIYGNHKMHKFSSSDKFPILCLIVSSIGTFNYDLACFLCNLLSTVVPDDYSCKDTFCFSN